MAMNGCIHQSGALGRSRMRRREALRYLSALAASTACLPSLHAAPPQKKCGMGLVVYVCRFHAKWLRSQAANRDLNQPIEFLQHCHQLGAGGGQIALYGLSDDQRKQLRTLTADLNLFVEGIVAPPSDRRDVDRFSRQVKSSAEAGADVLRTVVMPGRRYERFTTLEEFKEYEARARRMLELAAPVMEKERVHLAVENHKDQRSDERVALFEHIESEYVGACLDTGNSFALLEDPLTTVAMLGPWTKTVHLKDQGLQPSPDGFLLGDIPLGQGAFDLPAIVTAVRKHKPDVRFCLELITRDPLQVNCLKDQYWSTMPTVPGSELARTLRTVRQHEAKLARVSDLSLEQQVEVEDGNVRESIEYARDVLKI